MSLTPDSAQPVEYADYPSSLAALEAALADYQAIPADQMNANIQSSIQDLKAQIQGLKTQYRWELSQEEIDQYRQVIAHTAVLPETQGYFLNEEVYGLIDQYLAGRRSMEEVLRQLARRETMIQQENQ